MSRHRFATILTALGTAAGLAIVPAEAAPATPAATPQSQLSSLQDRYVASVVAPNGDRQPFAVTIVPRTQGALTAGNLLVGDFSNTAGTQGAGSSIVQVDPTTGRTTLFTQGGPVAGPVGLAINPVNDAVWVGDFGPANAATGVYDGSTSNMAVLAPTGAKVAEFTNSSTSGATNVTGIWGQSVSPAGGHVSFYWGNAGNAATGAGGGDVWRVDPHPTGTANGQPLNATYVKLATGLASTPPGNSAAGAVGPQGVAVNASNGTAYVTNDADSSLIALPGAATATGPVTPQVLVKGGPLNSPENVVINPTNGDLLVVNGAGNNNLVELTPAGQVVAVRDLAPGQPAGALFGLTATTDAAGNLVLYYVNQNEGSLHELRTRPAAVGYDLVAADGGVFTFGGATFHGSTGALHLNQPIVAAAASADGAGYWLMAADGGVFTFGDAPYLGSAAGRLTAPAVGFVPSKDGRGYWIVDAAGGVSAFGDAPALGDARAVHLAQPIVAAAATPDGAGYWLVARDGGVFTFGDATYHGSTGATHLNQPIVAAAASADGAGYWLVAADGGVFTFGDATYHGSTGATHLNQPIVGAAATPDGAGYWLVARDGGVFTFGDATYHGSTGATHLNQPVVAMAAVS